MDKANQDICLIGEGGFAQVYFQRSTGLVIKKLKDEYVSDKGIKSRFKREYNITKALQDLDGIIQVYSYDDTRCIYTMEHADTTLEKYILENNLSDDIKEKIIRVILTIMKNVHTRDILHRDLSPNNIFIVSGKIKIADFGLGKDLNVLASHQTMYTKSFGQYVYCAPEQYEQLRDADKQSDVFSLGRIVNFIMTGKPHDAHHIYSSITSKATNTEPQNRFRDAEHFLSSFERIVSNLHNKQFEENIRSKIQSKIFDENVEQYIYDMSPEKISKTLLSDMPGFSSMLLRFMKTGEEQAQHIIQSINQSFRDVCNGSFAAHDDFASFADDVLRGDFSFPVKEVAASILRYVAWDVNRFSAQRLVESLIDDGMDPMLEDIIRN